MEQPTEEALLDLSVLVRRALTEQVIKEGDSLQDALIKARLAFHPTLEHVKGHNLGGGNANMKGVLGGRTPQR